MHREIPLTLYMYTHTIVLYRTRLKRSVVAIATATSRGPVSHATTSRAQSQRGSKMVQFLKHADTGMYMYRQWVVSNAIMHADKSMRVMVTAQYERNPHSAQTISKNKVSHYSKNKVSHYSTYSYRTHVCELEDGDV